MKFVDVKNDVAFRKIFGNENRKEILISFLNAVLNLENNEQIVGVDILNPYQLPELNCNCSFLSISLPGRTTRSAFEDTAAVRYIFYSAQTPSMKNAACFFLLLCVGASASAQVESELLSASQPSIRITLPIGNELKPDGDVVGTPLFSERWMKATMTTWQHGDVKAEANYSYNFNLTNNELYIKNEKGDLYKADRKALKSFDLTDGAKTYHFERPKIVDFPSDVFCQVLYDTDSFYVYKSVKKTLRARNKEDGMFQTQDPKQEYEDQTDYYVKLSNKVLEKTRRLNLKMLENALPQAREKAFKDFCAKNKISGKLSDEEVVKAIDFLRGKITG